MFRKLVLPAVVAVAAVTGFAPAAQANCDVATAICEALHGECDPENCPLCFQDTYVGGTGPHSFCILP